MDRLDSVKIGRKAFPSHPLRSPGDSSISKSAFESLEFVSDFIVKDGNGGAGGVYAEELAGADDLGGGADVDDGGDAGLAGDDR